MTEATETEAAIEPSYVEQLRDPLVRLVANVLLGAPPDRERMHDLLEEGKVNWSCQATEAISKASEVVAALRDRLAYVEMPDD